MPMSFPVGRNAFGDPATGVVVPWDYNHKEEQAGARIRTITILNPTISRWKTVRAIRQQSFADEVILKLAGLAPTLRQHQMFLRFQDLSIRQTVIFSHCGGEAFECLLSDYEPQRRYVPRGPRGERYVWDYSLQIDVIAQLA